MITLVRQDGTLTFFASFVVQHVGDHSRHKSDTESP